MGYRGQGAFSNLEQLEVMWKGLGGYIGLVQLDVFNGLLVFLLIFFLGVMLYRLVKDRKITFRLENSLVWLIAIPTIFYFIIIAIVSPYIEIRYIMPICPLIFLLGIYLLKTVIASITKNELRVFICTATILVIIVLTPLRQEENITYVYPDLADIVQKLEGEYNLPTIYLFNTEQNRFMDDIYLFSKIDESYILDAKQVSIQKFKEIFEEKDISKGIIVFINGGQENDEELEVLKQATNLSQVEYMKRMNACDVYYLH